jgi:protein-S-isoprenylcysteine O-methyltransferase Ste14
MLIFIIIWSVWFISEIVLNSFLRSGSDDKKNQDKGSLIIIWATIFIAINLGVVSIYLFQIPISNSFIIPYFGLFLIIVGMIFRFISIWSLGRLFTVNVTIRDNHRIKKDGLYRFIRHPAYLGSLISFVGLGISFNNWLSLIIISILVTIAMLYRIRIEEKLLIEQFGAEYSDYMKTTFRLVPWIY